jgi:alkanesulfonate monooxygenase SsuD/methylene tetrahydromethanopterin reductase-like flavin-dependent oxidoreductase (luciferase family)
MGDSPLAFAANVDPSAGSLADAHTIAQRADELGLDLIGIQDHPYQWRFLDTWMLMATLLAETERVRVFPNVANLPLRGPVIIAKQAATLDVLSSGRFELGLGAGAFWEAIEAMGGPARSPREALEALEEAVRIIRLFWSGERTIAFEGRYYTVKGLHPGPAPVHSISIWIGAYKPKMLNLIGRLADGWVPSLPYAPPDQIPAMQQRIDEGAREAGRDPGAIRRIYNVMGEITDGPTRGLLEGAVEHWVEELTRFVVELGFDTFTFWAGENYAEQLERFAREVVPGVVEATGRRRVEEWTPPRFAGEL